MYASVYVNALKQESNWVLPLSTIFVTNLQETPTSSSHFFCLSLRPAPCPPIHSWSPGQNSAHVTLLRFFNIYLVIFH